MCKRELAKRHSQFSPKLPPHPIWYRDAYECLSPDILHIFLFSLDVLVYCISVFPRVCVRVFFVYSYCVFFSHRSPSGKWLGLVVFCVTRLQLRLLHELLLPLLPQRLENRSRPALEANRRHIRPARRDRRAHCFVLTLKI